jgi:tetratricopeptide (TPR) repeat protein
VEDKINRVRRLIAVAIFAARLAAAADRYEVRGSVGLEARASVSLFGVASPFTISTLSDEAGRFQLKNIEPGAYTLAIFLPALGEARQTIEIGPSTADARGVLVLTLRLRDTDFHLADTLQRRHAVSASTLAIPGKALREYQEAQKDLARHDAGAAAGHLLRAVELAPQYTAAWNNLGTIAYQTQKFERAEECFREALAHDPQAFEPLVNLGGVLINLHKLDEAREYNLHAVLMRPEDALANSQLGMTYFELNQPEVAEKFLEVARRIDPAHFSHPQLILAEIHLRRGDRLGAASDLEDFLKHHPDWHTAARMRDAIHELRR